MKLEKIVEKKLSNIKKEAKKIALAKKQKAAVHEEEFGKSAYIAHEIVVNKKKRR